jgi:hypothetical protein
MSATSTTESDENLTSISDETLHKIVPVFKTRKEFWNWLETYNSPRPFTPHVARRTCWGKRKVKK